MMKNTNIILLIVLCVIGITNLVKVFTIDHNIEDAKLSLQDAKAQVKDAQNLTTKAQKQITNLQKSLDKYEVKNERLQLEIDSISFAKKAKAPIDWEDRQNIKKKQKEISDRLTYLREKDNEFE